MDERGEVVEEEACWLRVRMHRLREIGRDGIRDASSMRACLWL